MKIGGLNFKFIFKNLSLLFVWVVLGFYLAVPVRASYCDETAATFSVITQSCTFQKLNTGIDNGVLEVRSGVLTVDGNQTLAFGALNLTGGSMALTEGAKLLPGMYIWMIDADGDGYPATLTEYVQKQQPTDGRRKYLMNTSTIVDCSETYYSITNTCCTQVTWYRDVDGDGYGNPSGPTTMACAPVPSGYSANNTDCDDNDGTVSRTISPAKYLDADGDTYGTGALTSCAPQTGNYTASNGTDCNDSNASVSRTISPAKYLDADGDTYGTGALTSCAPQTGNYTASNGTDCNDSNASVFRSVNGYLDSDLDGYGSGSLATCVGASGSYVGTNTDCGPNTATAYPGSATCSNVTFLNASSVASYDYDCSTNGGTGSACGTLMWNSASQYLGVGYRYDCSAATCNPYAARGYWTTLTPTHTQVTCGSPGVTTNPTGPVSCKTCTSCSGGVLNCGQSGQEGPIPSGSQTCK